MAKRDTIKGKPRVPSGKKLLQVPMDAELHHKFKVYAVLHSETMVGLIEKFVRQTVEKRRR